MTELDIEREWWRLYFTQAMAENPNTDPSAEVTEIVGDTKAYDETVKQWEEEDDEEFIPDDMEPLT